MTDMANDTQIDIIEKLETFLYTPYGLGTLAGVSALVTSFLWLLVCCICCCFCHWKKVRNDEDGLQEADQEIDFIDSTTVASGKPNTGTMSSGYNTGPASYSMVSPVGSNSRTAILDSSMDLTGVPI